MRMKTSNDTNAVKKKYFPEKLTFLVKNFDFERKILEKCFEYND